MAVAIRIHSTGAPDVMQMEEVHLSSPGPGEVLLAQTAIGVNPLDVSQRKGAVAIALPSGLGLEGAATVTAVGAGVSGLQVGDRVGYATGPLGASGARASADFGGSTKAPTSKAALPPRKVRRFRVACRCWFRRSNTGVWHRQPNRRWVLSSSGTEGEMDGSCTATSFKDGE